MVILKNHKKFWNRLAKNYEYNSGKNEEKNNIIIERIKDFLHPDTIMLELAAGTGIYALKLAPFSKHIEATDFSEDMIKIANEKEIPNNVSFSVQDATNLTYSDKSSDVVLITHALHVIPNPEKALENIYRVLKDDGI
ncbi:class I SAM-dependent methyltransferase [Clostridium sp. Marseille-Q7071]